MSHNSHTFLLQPDRWQTRGNYFDNEGLPIPTAGTVEVIHGSEIWQVQSSLGLEDSSDRYDKTVEIEVLAGSAQLSRWQAEDSIMGAITGVYVVVDDKILSWYQSISRQYHGYEFLQQVSPNRYEAAGAVFKEQFKTGSWLTQWDRCQ